MQILTAHKIDSPGSIVGIDARLEPTSNDIVFGRGKKYQDHEGNKRMRDCINEYKQLYNALKRFQKQTLVETIYEKLVESGARFLRKDEVTDSWLLVKRELATQKVSHALRCKKHLGKSSTKNLQDLNEHACPARKNSNSTIESTVSTRGDDSHKNRIHVIEPAAGRSTPVIIPVAVKAGIHTLAATPIPSVAALQALHTLQIQDMLHRQRLLAMFDMQRQAAEQQAFYNAAVSQILVQHTKQASE